MLSTLGLLVRLLGSGRVVGDGIPPYEATNGQEDGGSTGIVEEEVFMKMGEVGSMLVTRAMEYSGSGIGEMEKLL